MLCRMFYIEVLDVLKKIDLILLKKQKNRTKKNILLESRWTWNDHNNVAVKLNRCINWTSLKRGASLRE